MKPNFWIKRFFVIFIGAFLILLVVGLFKKRSLERAIAESAVWAGLTAVVFVTARIYQSRKGQHCALCRDTPEMARGGRCDVSSDGHLRK
jgi:cell division protein FtsW (lipid II flippase)